MAQTFTLPKQVVIDPLTGNPAPGAKAFFYATGTSTPQTVYSDDELTTPITQPVVADSAGVLPVIYLGASADYKLTLTRTDDTLLYTIDPLENVVTLSTAIKYDITPAEDAAGVTPNVYYKYPAPWKDISRFVSDNTGATDVTTQFNEALKAEKRVSIPDGIYKITDSLIWQDYMTIEGSGNSAIIKGDLSGKSFFRSAYGETPAIGQRPVGVLIKNVFLQPLTAATITTGSVGINARNAQYCTFEDIIMQYTDYGVVTDQIAQFLRFSRIHAQIHNTAFWSNGTTGGNNDISDCSFGGNVVALDLDGGTWDVSKTDCSAILAGTSYCVRLGRPGGVNTTVHADKMYIEGVNAANVTLQVENSVTRSRVSMHRHSTLGTIVNNAGENCMIEVPGQGFYNPVYRTQRIEFAAAIDGSAQSGLRSNGGNTLEARNAANSGYANFSAAAVSAGGAAFAQAGFTTIGNTSAGTIGAAGGASALPATPLGYLICYIGTTQVKIPYYNP